MDQVGVHLKPHVLLCPPRSRSQEEGLAEGELAARGFDYLLTGEAAAVPGFEVVSAVEGYQSVQLAARSPLALLRALAAGRPPVRVALSPQVFIQQRIDNPPA